MKSTTRTPGYLARFAAILLLFGLFTPMAALAAAWPPDTGKGPCAVTKTADVPATMRDGVVLRADIYRPATDKPVPVILMRTQYGKSAAQVQPERFQSPAWFASHCYIVVIQDIRGQYASGGTFYEYAHDRDDGYDSVEWAAALPGSNGKVGMYGSSYVGATQWLAATAAPPHLAAIVPSNTASDYYEGWTYENGAFRLGFIEPWMTEDIVESAAANRKDTATVADMHAASLAIARWMQTTPYDRLSFLQPDNPAVAPYFFDALKHPTNDAYWQAFSIEPRWNKVAVPVLAFDGWYDAFLYGALRNFNGVQAKGATALARESQRIVIGPWEHIGWGREGAVVSPRLAALGPIADSPVDELMLAWFDHFLKGEANGVETGPRVDYFVMGENRWHVAKAWPLAGTRYESWRLASGGAAASVMGDGRLESPASAAASGPPDSYVYDPANPVPSVGGHSCCAWSSGPQGQFDQSAIEQRADILVYSSPPLEQPLEITGPVKVVLYARSTAPDTDFTAKLVDVFPDGSAINLNNGVLRASFRESSTHPTPIVPGQIYRYEIAVWPTSNLFKTGHRIRLEISSSDFPQFAPDPNTGGSLSDSSAMRPATQTILHDPEHPSILILPVIPPEAQGPAADTPPMR
jgi:putative CocE/NonD family hydrolase